MSARGTWAAACALYCGLTVLYFRPLLGGFGSMLPHDIGDPGLTTWMLWWNAHAVPLTERWWNAPIFYPIHGAFALSETLLAPALIAAPLMWSGVSAVGAHNAAHMLSFPAAAMAAHALAFRLTRRHDAALIAGLAFGFHPYRASQLPHVQLLWSMFMPLALLALHRYLDERRLRHLIVAGVCWVLNGLSSGYYFVFFAALTALWMWWFVRDRRDLFAIGTTLAGATAALAPVLLGSVAYQRQLGFSRGRGEIETFSADVSSLWIASPHTWLPSHWSLASRPEGELYQGVAIMVISLAAAALAWRSAPKAPRLAIRARLAIAGSAFAALAALVWGTGGWEGTWHGIPYSMTHPHRLMGVAIFLFAIVLLLDRRLAVARSRRSLLAFYALAAALMFVLALGPTAHVFDVRFMDKAPYYWFMQLPGGSAVRVPARFAMLVALCLCQAAALGFARLTPGGRRPWLAAVAGIAVLADGWVPAMPVVKAPPPMTLQSLARDVPVIEVPTFSLYNDTPAMLRSFGHGHWLVNGFSGFVPPFYPALQRGLLDGDASVLDAVRGDGPLLVVVNREWDPNDNVVHMVRTMPNAILHSNTAIGPAYLVSGPARVSNASSGQPIGVAAIETNRNASALPALTDGQVSSRWTTGAPQQVGDEVIITLQQPALVQGLEMDLGEIPFDYPRGLRVVAEADGEPARVVWEAEIAGRAVRAALDDPARTAVFVPFSDGVVARRLVLTVTRPSPDAFWSMAEIRVVGRPSADTPRR